MAMTITITDSKGRVAQKVISAAREQAVRDWLRSIDPSKPSDAIRAEGSARRWLLAEIENILNRPQISALVTSPEIETARSLVEARITEALKSIDTFEDRS